jgi:hypothetical protein
MLKKRKPPASGFYEEVLDETRRKAIRDAKAVNGLDQDIALLRAIVRSEFSQPMTDHAQVLRIIGVICKAESVRDRLSARNGNDLRNSVAGVLHDVGDLLDGTGSGDD